MAIGGCGLCQPDSLCGGGGVGGWIVSSFLTLGNGLSGGGIIVGISFDKGLVGWTVFLTRDI